MLAFAGIDIDLAGTIGLGELLVAVGTLALAMFTAWLAFETRSLAQETEEDVSAEWRPVLLEVAQKRMINPPSLRSGSAARTGTQAPDSSRDHCAKHDPDEHFRV
jgi:hypothetical protein